MNRAEIEELNGTQPHSFETEREQQWYESGLKEGLTIADEEPKPNKNINDIMDNFVEEQNLSIKKSVFDDIIRWISKQDKIFAIRVVKTLFDSGLKEAYEYVDLVRNEHVDLIQDEQEQKS